MTRDEIIRLAREAGLLVIGTADGSEAVYTWPQGITEEIERFATLIAAAEREKVAAWMVAHLYATGHGDTTEDMLKELEWQIAEREREACAKVCEETNDGTPYNLTEQCAAAIRARGEK